MNARSDDINVTPSTTPLLRDKLVTQLADLIPEVIADGKVDIEKLRILLSEDDGDDRERFGLYWPGKKSALRAAQEPTEATLKPLPGASVSWNSTGNVFIEGDNLEVLKILQKNYHGKIKMIYIDPPYNTGQDFVYPDNYKEGLESYLEWTRQVTAEGKKLSTNSESEGRFHSNWLNMMYPRLKLARNLLTEDGVIFVSIDDNEFANLKLLLNEIFGENCVEAYVWDVREAGQIPKTPKSTVRKEHEYLLAAWRKPASRKFNKYKDQPYLNNEKWTNVDSDPRGPWMSGNLSRSEDSEGSGSNYFEIVTPTGKKWNRTWTVGRDEFERLKSEGRIYFADGGNGVPRRKIFKTDTLEVTQSSIFQSLGSSQSGRRVIEELTGQTFSYPKPVELIRRLCALTTNDNDIVLDFFAGSGTTAQAVMEQNEIDGNSRRYVLVQLPEPTPEDSDAHKAGFKTISSITIKRLERAGLKIKDSLSGHDLDTGFRVYSLTETNFIKWRMNSEVTFNELQQHLLDLRESANDSAAPENILVEILLKLGYSLSEKIEKINVGGLELFSISSNLILAYLDQSVKPTLDQLKLICNLSPAKIIVLEDSINGDDELKTNFVQVCKASNIELWTA